MAEGPELQVKYSVTGVEDVKKANQEVVESGKKVEDQVKQSGTSFEKYRDILGKVSAFAGGAFVTAALAAGKAVYNANEQVNAMEKSLRVSSGSMQNYERNQRTLTEVADKYHKSVFSIAEGLNNLTRETRGTINEGLRTQQILDDLTVASGKTGNSIGQTTDQFANFTDKMKEGNVDSTNLSNELDKRLYEAFVKVAEGMGATTEELNELLKESDKAVATVLPQLSRELKNSLGDVPQQNAKDLGGSIEYATSKLTMFLDGLFQTSGAKSAFIQAAEDAGSFLDVLNRINREHGLMAAGGAAISAGAVKAVNGLTGLNLEFDPFAYGAEAIANAQRKTLQQTSHYSNGSMMQWGGAKKEAADSPFPIGYQQIAGAYDIKSELYANRIEAEEKANAKLIAAAKKAAAERKRALDEITRQEIEESNLRIREGILAAERTVRESYANRPSSGISKGLLNNTGTERKFGTDQEKSHEEFSNPVSMGNNLGYDSLLRAVSNITAAWVKEKAAKEATTAATNDLAIATERLDEQYRSAIENISEGGTVDVFSSLAEGLGKVAAGTGSIEEVGARVAMAFGNMITQIGEATIAYGVTKSGLEKALAATFGTPGGGVAAILIGAAAVAAGSMLKATANKSQSQAMSRMWDGGIADPIGTDRIPTLLTPGEMVLPMREQAQLYGMIKQSRTGSVNSPAVGVGANQNMTVTFQGELLGSTINLSNKRAQLESNYYN